MSGMAKISSPRSITTENGKTVTLDVPAKIENGRTLVPLRFISESLDAEVKWNADIYRIDIEENKYDEISEFVDGLAKVCKYGEWDYSRGQQIIYYNNKYGLINEKREEVVACIYDEISDFFDGVAIVAKEGEYIREAEHNPIGQTIWVTYKYINGKYGCIDTEGNEIIPCIYSSADEVKAELEKIK